MVSLNALNALINELKDPGGVDNDPLVELLVAFVQGLYSSKREPRGGATLPN